MYLGTCSIYELAFKRKYEICFTIAVSDFKLYDKNGYNNVNVNNDNSSDYEITHKM